MTTIEIRIKQRFEKLSNLFDEVEAISFYTREENKRLNLEAQKCFLEFNGQFHELGNVDIF